MPKSYYLSNKFIDAGLRNQPFTSPIVVYVALFTTMPTAAGGGIEVTGGGYGRQIGAFTVPVNGSSSNASDVLFPVATASWGTVVGFGVYDSSSGGNLMYFNVLSAPRTVNVSDQVRFPAGQILAFES